MSNLLQDFLDKNLHLGLRGRYELIWINIDNDKTLSDYGKKYHIISDNKNESHFVASILYQKGVKELVIVDINENNIFAD